MSVYAEYRHGMITREEFLAAVQAETMQELADRDRSYGYYQEEEDTDE